MYHKPIKTHTAFNYVLIGFWYYFDTLLQAYLLVLASVSKTDVLDTLILLRVTAALTKKEAGNISRLRFFPCYTIIQRCLLRSVIFSFSIDILYKSANSLKSVMCIPVAEFIMKDENVL